MSRIIFRDFCGEVVKVVGSQVFVLANLPTLFGPEKLLVVAKWTLDQTKDKDVILGSSVIADFEIDPLTQIWTISHLKPDPGQEPGLPSKQLESSHISRLSQDQGQESNDAPSDHQKLDQPQDCSKSPIHCDRNESNPQRSIMKENNFEDESRSKNCQATDPQSIGQFGLDRKSKCQDRNLPLSKCHLWECKIDPTKPAPCRPSTHFTHPKLSHIPSSGTNLDESTNSHLDVVQTSGTKISSPYVPVPSPPTRSQTINPLSSGTKPSTPPTNGTKPSTPLTNGTKPCPFYVSDTKPCPPICGAKPCPPSTNGTRLSQSTVLANECPPFVTNCRPPPSPPLSFDLGPASTSSSNFKPSLSTANIGQPSVSSSATTPPVASKSNLARPPSTVSNHSSSPLSRTNLRPPPPPPPFQKPVQTQLSIGTSEPKGHELTLVENLDSSLTDDDPKDDESKYGRIYTMKMPSKDKHRQNSSLARNQRPFSHTGANLPQSKHFENCPQSFQSRNYTSIRHPSPISTRPVIEPPKPSCIRVYNARGIIRPGSNPMLWLVEERELIPLVPPYECYYDKNQNILTSNEAIFEIDALVEDTEVLVSCQRIRDQWTLKKVVLPLEP